MPSSFIRVGLHDVNARAARVAPRRHESHINPYGRFRLNMDTHLDLSGASSTGTAGVESVL